MRVKKVVEIDSVLDGLGGMARASIRRVVSSFLQPTQ